MENEKFWYYVVNDTTTTGIYTLNLHNELTIWFKAIRQVIATVASTTPAKPPWGWPTAQCQAIRQALAAGASPTSEKPPWVWPTAQCPAIWQALAAGASPTPEPERKSTRLNYNHKRNTYAVLRLTKKKHVRHVLLKIDNKQTRTIPTQHSTT